MTIEDESSHRCRGAHVPLWISVLETTSFAVTHDSCAVTSPMSMVLPGLNAADVQDRMGPDTRGVASAVHVSSGNIVGSITGATIITARSSCSCSKDSRSERQRSVTVRGRRNWNV